jgi:hypothetical protein
MNEKIEKIKKHIVENKLVYILGAGAFAAGTGVGLTIGIRQIVVTDVANVKWHSPTINNIIASVERRGHPGNVIRCNETGEIFASQNHAAKLMGLNPGSLSSHLSGKYDHANGYTFEKLGEAVTSQE